MYQWISATISGTGTSLSENSGLEVRDEVYVGKLLSRKTAMENLNVVEPPASHCDATKFLLGSSRPTCKNYEKERNLNIVSHDQV